MTPETKSPKSLLQKTPLAVAAVVAANTATSSNESKRYSHRVAEDRLRDLVTWSREIRDGKTPDVGAVRRRVYGSATVIPQDADHHW